MKFFKFLGIGYKNYWNGLKFVFKHKLYWFIIFPILLFWGIFELGKHFEALEGSVGYHIKHDMNSMTSLNGLTWMTLKMIFYQKMYYLFTKFALYFVIILLSPVLAVISEKVESILTGNKYPWNFWQLLKDVKRAVRLNLRLMLIEYTIIISFIVIGMFLDGAVHYILVYAIPIVIGFYFYGFGFIDYVNERRRLNIAQSIHFVGRHKGLAFALGSIFSLCFYSFNFSWREFLSLHPNDTNGQLMWGTFAIISFILAAIAPIIAITSSTLSMHEIVDLGNKYATKADEKEAKEESADETTETDDETETETKESESSN
jgi:CysZ protein